MAVVVVGEYGGNLSQPQVIAELAAKVGTDLERLGAKVFKCNDHLIFRGAVDLSNLTFIFADGRFLKSEGTVSQPSKITAGTVVGGKLNAPLKLVFLGYTGMHEHSRNVNEHGMFVHSEADIQQLHIELQRQGGSYQGVTIASDQKIVINELVITNSNPAGRTYVNIDAAHAQSSIKMHTLRGATLRVAACPDFGFSPDGQGWHLGEGGDDFVKYLTPEGGETVGFSPVFASESGAVEMSNTLISGDNTATFTDSFLSNPDTQVRVYPQGRDGVKRTVKRTLHLKPVDSSGQAIASFKTYISSNRTVFGAVTETAGTTELFNQTYNSGDKPKITVWQGWNTTGGGTYKVTGKRVRDGDFQVSVVTYNHLPTKADYTGYQGGAQFTETLREDSSVAETDKAAVDAYTQISTAAQFYDAAKAWLVDNYSGQDEALVTRQGDVVDAGSYDVVVNKTATSAFGVQNGTTLIIKADTFTGSIKTTGEVKTENGATISGGVIDKNGDSFLSFSGIDTWEVYSAIADANTQNNALGSGTAAQTFRFTYQAGTTYHLRVTTSGETLFKKVTPTASGATLVNLGTAGQIAALGGTLATIQNTMAKDETALKASDLTSLAKETTASSARDHARAANAQTKPKTNTE